MREPTFLLALAIAATTLIVLGRTIAGAFAGRGATRSEVAKIQEQLDHYAAALEDAQTESAQQAAQLAELQERLDFAERLLAQGRDRSPLSAGEKRD